MKRLLQLTLMIAFYVASSYQQACSLQSNSDIDLPNLTSVSGQQQGNCCGICQSTQGCQGYAWNDFQGGTCWLKAGTGPIKVAAGVTVGILSGGNGCNVQSNSDIALPNLAVSSGQRLENCCNICSGTAGCQGYAWNDFNGGTCWLKAGTGPVIPNPGVSVGTLSGSGSQNPPVQALVSFNEFLNAVVSNGYPQPSQAVYNAFVQGLPNGSISTKEEAAMALAELLHESAGLTAKREIRCESNGCPGEYETPGCDVSGQRYYGRGYIQLTWCTNYRAASQDLLGDASLVTNPDSVATNENLAWNTAFWFWKVNVHSQAGVTNGQFGAATKAINGALECGGGPNVATARIRYAIYGKVRAAFGLNGPGDESGCYN